MNSLQIGFIIATFTFPVLCWLLARGGGPAVERGIGWFFALALILAYGTSMYLEYSGGNLSLDARVPMHLCDWAMVVMLMTFFSRSQAAFELAYCGAPAGTLQGLLPPAIELTNNPRSWSFLIVHSAIPACVIWLLFM